MIDLHAHILPGLDDGVRSPSEARDLARAAVAEGITAMAATPHVRDDYPTTADQMEDALAGLRLALAEAAIPLHVLAGGELALTRLVAMENEELVRFTLNRSGKYLLVEFPYYGWPLALEQIVFDLRLAGITPLIAHPERSAEIQERPARLEQAVASGAKVQVTAGSLDGRFGRRARRAAHSLLELGLVHVLASDTHGATRGVGLASALRALRDPGLARYLTTDAPAAIVAGERLPARPRRRSRLLRG